MKKAAISAFIIVCSFFFLSPDVKALSVKFTFTADNEIMAWYQHYDSSLTLLPTGSNVQDWRIADSNILQLEPDGTYSFIWKLRNVSGIGGSPGGFLAEIQLDDQLPSSSLLSSSSWEVAFVEDFIGSIDIGSLSWKQATEYGANDDETTIWQQYNNNDPILNIAGNAQWIWWELNWTDANAPWSNDTVYVRNTLTIETNPVPIPGAVFLLGSGLIGLVGIRKKIKS